ncbi:hypothetical protein TRV_07466 [Trichophyton verrucosum HKI 0517]|uniref:Uncharacterized protein n=1 Tax=Trichophyton verrucosum (strain HKI 0517) TaxID=663202 RepID=D4DJU8_TRIVH|nr:uncharacterized protein TRV_07466 [Trichophyton verrucosum HKI 0517]EFE37875.1 hypothetical protein TRV_07466 [Trichophyton verrucosum HKI 0517]
MASKALKYTTELFNGCSPTYKRLLTMTAEGNNPHVTFPFKGIKLPRGTKEHCPFTDLEEVRNSVTIQFLGTPYGNITAHLFNDGTIKTSTMMHQENNRRREHEARLLAEENKFPHLNQTPLRTQAYNRKMAKIRNARDNSTWSIMKKQLEKATAEEEYSRFLQEQAEQRAKAAKK